MQNDLTLVIVPVIGKKKQNDITYKKASNIHINEQFKDMYKSYQFVYDDEKVYDNLDLLFYRVHK